MAAVAGTFSEIAWQYLRNYGSEIIIENGGDIVSDSQKERIIKVFAGSSIFSGKIGIKLSPGKTWNLHVIRHCLAIVQLWSS